MKKIRALALGLVLSLALALTGCTSAEPLPEGMELEPTAEAGRQIVSMLMDGDYQGVCDAFRPEMREEYGVTAEAIEELMGKVDTEKVGPFVEIYKTLAVGGDSDDFDEPFASVTVYCEHEKKDVIYGLSLDSDFALLGLEIKTK